MPYLQRPGARIWWEQTGSGTPVLLIMGHAYGAGMWHRALPELAGRHRVIRFDNRGIGRSSDPPGPYPVPVMAGDAAAVLDAAGADSAHVYGVSMGGFIALQLALEHPGRVQSLTLGCTAAAAPRGPHGALVTRIRSLVPAPVLNRMARNLLYGPNTATRLKKEDQQVVQHTRASTQGRHGQLTGMADFDVTTQLGQIRVPTLILHGSRDRIVPFASAQQLAAGITGSRLVAFPGAGHIYTTDVPAAANHEFLRFLADNEELSSGPV